MEFNTVAFMFVTWEVKTINEERDRQSYEEYQRKSMSSPVGREPEKHKKMSEGEWDNVDSEARAGLLNLLV